ncbi:cache domain-containing protein [Limisalsivibrio acetivorans]|uniref:cache domain-containing protein n=1 Tax=Limisalsivibrio acetivorans TaxID=1304888 RepID=UPI0003B6CEEC|nr:cache domain-containing protein [Limisalsivibrio acetivorans]
MKKSIRARSLFMLYSAAILIVVTVTMGVFFIQGHRQSAEDEIERLKRQYTELEKKNARRTVTEAVSYLEFRDSYTNELLREDKSKRSGRALEMISSLYRENSSILDPEQLKKSALLFLKHTKGRHEGDYFFTVDCKTETVSMHPSDQEVLGRHVSEIRDGEGRVFLPSSLSVCSSGGAGYLKYYWQLPGKKKGRFYEKTTFYQYSPEMDTIIYTGDYPGAVEQRLKRDALAHLSSIRFGNNYYLVVMDLSGTIHAHADKSLIGVNHYSSENKQLNAIMASIDDAVSKTGKGFFTYKWSRPGIIGTDEYIKKYGYAMVYEKWGWIVVGGMYLEDLEKEVANIRSSIDERLRRDVKYTIFILAASSIMIFIFSILFSARLSADFDRLTAFFRRSETEKSEMDTDSLFISDLKEVGVRAGELVNTLHIYKENLEVMVAERTAELEKALEENIQANLFRNAALDTMPNPFFYKGSDGKYIIVNKAFADFNGVSAQDVLGKTSLELSPSRLAEKDFEMDRQLLEQGAGETQIYEAKVKRFDDVYADVIFYKAVVPDKDGEAAGIVGTFIDITERKNIERELVQARKTAEDANEAKSRFLAAMSHEIRTPMNAIIGMTDTLKESVDDPEQKQFINIISNASDNLMSIINDILDISRVESGMLKLDRSIFNVRELLEQCTDISGIRATEKGVDMVCYIGDGVPKAAVGDPLRLRQILSNFLSNAVKFTEEGYVIIRVSNISTEESKTLKLRFDIEDTGIGIAEDKKELIFDRFTQADTSATRRFGGTGLGLSICRHLVNMMEGTITVQSEPGRGSVFSFSAVLEHAPGEFDSTPLPDLSSDRFYVDLKSSVLSGYISEIFTGYGGAEVNEFAQAEIVVTDKSSAEIIELYKGDGRYIISVIDRRADSEAIGRYAAAGVQGFLRKPLKLSQIEATLLSIAQPGYIINEEFLQETPPPEEAPELDILVAEDSENNRLVVETLLKDYPFTISFAENGRLAVQMACEKEYDLIIMDIEMPEMDGFDAISNIRADSLNMYTPCIAMTAHAFPEHVQKCKDAGFDSYISKPLDKRGFVMSIIMIRKSSKDKG